MSGQKIESILFVCGQNAVRSPIARALAESLYPGRFRTASAGVVAGDRDPFVDAVLAEIGLTLGDHEPTSLEGLGDLDFDLAITLSPEAHHQTLERMRAGELPVEYWPTPDPTGAFGSREQILASYRALRDLLSLRLRQRFSETAGS